MSFFQISAVLFGLFMLYVVRIHHKKIYFSLVELFFWYSLWMLFIFLSVFPQFLTGISEFFFFDRVFDLLVVCAFMVISFLVIITYFKYREMNLKIDKLVRHTAITTLKKKLELKKN